MQAKLVGVNITALSKGGHAKLKQYTPNAGGPEVRRRPFKQWPLSVLPTQSGHLL